MRRGATIEYLSLFKEYQALAIPIIIVLLIFKSEIITDLEADSVQKVLWSKSKKIQIGIGRFILISILSAIFIGVIGSVIENWWSWINVGVSWTSATVFFIALIILTFEELSGRLQNKFFDFMEAHPKIISVAFFIYFIFVTYMLSFTLFTHTSELMKSMMVERNTVIFFGSIVYGVFAAIQLIVVARVIFRKDKAYKLLWNGDEYNIICVTSDNLIQLELMDGSGYRFVEKDVLKECVILEK